MGIPNRRERCDQSAHARSAPNPQKNLLSSRLWLHAAKRQSAKYAKEILTFRRGGGGWPCFRARFQRSRMINEIVSMGMPWLEENAWAPIKKKKIMGSQRISAAAVRALAVPALR